MMIDGGGVRGMSSLMILKDIMCGLNRGRSPKNTQQPWQAFGLIGGTSTGG
jgi:patatin-like phospholipase/acyl hydrolase